MRFVGLSPIFLLTTYITRFFFILKQRVLKDLVAENLKRGCSNIFCKTIGLGVLLLDYASLIFFRPDSSRRDEVAL